MKLEPNQFYRVSGRGDLAFDGELRPLIGKDVEFTRLTKSGLAYVRFEGKMYSIPQRNLYDANVEPSSTPVDLSQWKVEESKDLKAYHSIDLEANFAMLLSKSVI